MSEQVGVIQRIISNRRFDVSARQSRGTGSVMECVFVVAMDSSAVLHQPYAYDEDSEKAFRNRCHDQRHLLAKMRNWTKTVAR